MENQFFKPLEALLTGEAVALDSALAQLRFDEQGLIPVIAQQHDTGEVLMMAWMNREALAETLEKQQVCYWSRSRQQLWRKGETSGNTQQLIEMRIDCDGDTILCLVNQTGPACHTNRNNCFYLSVEDDQLKIITDVSTENQ